MSEGVARYFAATYVEARAKFLAAAAEKGLTLTRHQHPGVRGAAGEVLSLDVATLGDPAASGVLILISGTHGAEGFCGSGAQVGLLDDETFLRDVAAAGLRVVFVHALNPYGFSHLRRTNEDNIDLNRNFRSFAVKPTPNAAYAAVHPFVVPATWPPPDEDALTRQFIATHGLEALQAAIAGGQCEFPDGLFYGGVAPAWSNLVLRGVLRKEASSCRQLGWIDFHTGLGPRGHGEKIYAGGNRPADVARTRAWWGAEVTSFIDGTSSSPPLTGINGLAVYDECPGVEFAGIALEYGTLPVPDVINALRADQWLENHPEADAKTRDAIKRQLRDAFYQDADDWKTMILTQARTAVGQALAAMGRPA